MRLIQLVNNLKLSVKLNLTAILVFGLLLTGVVLTTTGNLRTLIRQVGRQNITQDAQAIQKRVGEIEDETLSNTRLLSITPGLLESLVARDIQTIRAEILVAGVRLDLDSVEVVDAKGRHLLNVKSTGQEDEDRLIKLALLSIEATGVVVEESSDGSLISMAAAVPIKDASGATVGALFSSHLIDDEIISRVNIFSAQGVNLGLIYDGRVVASDFERPEDLDYFSAYLLNTNLVGQALNGETLVASDLITDATGSPYALGHTPLTIGGDTRAAIGIVADMDELAVFQRQLVFTQLILFTLITLAAMAILTVFASRSIIAPIRHLQSSAERWASGNYAERVSSPNKDEIGQLANSFDSMAAQFSGLIGSLEQRVAERTRNLQLAAEVGRTVSQVRVLDVMLKDACELILKEFDLYYVQVYLADASQKTLRLEAGTGTVGEQLLERGHSLPLNTGSINGRAAVEKYSVVISDTAQSATFRQNPLLPYTRGEVAVPLIVANKVVGVLDMQSSTPGVLNDEILPAFEALAGQLAVAIQNASLLADAEQARAQVEAQARRLVRTTWSEHLDAIHKPERIGFVFDHNQVTPLMDVDASQPATNEKTISASISVTGESLGSLVMEIDDDSRREQAGELVSVVARQVSQQIENLRLLESAERYRDEAEQAVRRQTRENWQTYFQSGNNNTLSYLYDLNEVRLQKNGYEAKENVYASPLKVRDEAIGRLAVEGLGSDDHDAMNLVNTIAERLTAHIEGLRQSDQTQSALAQSEILFDASRNLTQATDLQQLVDTAVSTLKIPAINRAILVAFNFDEATSVVSMDVIANWWNGTGQQITAIGTHYPLEVVRVMPMFVSPIPVFFNDAFNDERVDGTTMQLVKRLNLRAVAVLPLHVGSGQIGALILEAEEPHNFTGEETRLFTAIAPQIATIVDNRRQFERAQRQADRESRLNVISQKIQSATTVEAVLQIAARELGHTLGAPLTIAQLGLKEDPSSN